MSELWSRPLPLALLCLAAMAWLVWFPHRALRARSWVLFRSLVPAWRFFEQIEPVPALQYRVAPHGQDWSEWREALTVPPRTRGSLLLNAPHNLYLACQSLIEHLVDELEDAAELARDERELEDAAELARDERELVAYNLVCALIEERARQGLPRLPTLRYQFRLADAEVGRAPLFISRVHDAA